MSFDSVVTLLVRWASASWLRGLSFESVKQGVRWVSQHTGVPALVVAAILIAVGYRVLKKGARFAIEVAAVGLLLFAASEMGWIRW